ncbi:MAG: NADH-quinone oxidoreductase subunit [Gaiellales bacterium]|jgi:NADH-quinone oxidoreductase subunit L|nr:NADH-quinone oxidoreductase subunit [Gaiellales bacterium]
MTATYAAWVALAAPLAGLAFTTAIGPSVSRRTVGVVASGAILAGFVASCVALVSLLRHSPDQRVEVSTGWHWVSAGQFQTHVSILVDPLSVIMLLVVTGVGFLIHAYSVGYMQGDREERRFFAYLNLFVFSMLVLVLAGDFVILLVGWGMVGLSSYLLIGFWWERPAAVAAAKKAFIMNAIGDIGIALGIFVIWDHVHSTDYLTVFGQAGGAGIPIGSHTANWIALLLLLGAVAKSAQLPLQTWLPDAMEGPTPVSALIHAATMVTAGVYLVARMWPLYTAAPDVSDLVALIGAATLTMAGLIALVQTDIKRVIAYSTMSQIGYMFCAVGIGAYSAGIYHLLTHAFFKALLFLGAGVVIHALDDEQDIRKMGGLRRFMPFTAALMWIGGLALAGIPPFAGFFSKDQILADAMHVGGIVGWIVWSLGLLGAFVTSIYTFRMLLKVFSGRPSPFAAEHAPTHTEHGEGPISMLWTIGVLAAGAVLAGLLEIPGVTHGMRDFLAPAVPRAVEATGGQELFTSVLSVAVALAGLAVAYAIWGPSGHGARAYARATEPLPRLFEHKFGFDIAYDVLIARPVAALAALGARVWEGRVVASTMDGAGPFGRWLSGRLSLAQSGLVRSYAVMFAFGIGALAVWFVGRGV